MQQVDRILASRIGLQSADLEDQPYYDAFESGTSPAEMVADVLDFVREEYGFQI